MRDNLIVIGGIILLILLLFVGYKVVTIVIGPLRVEMEAPESSNPVTAQPANVNPPLQRQDNSHTCITSQYTSLGTYFPPPLHRG